MFENTLTLQFKIRAIFFMVYISTLNTYFKKSIKYIVLLALIYMPVFGHLDTLPIRIWDESRLAINSYEMAKNGDYVVTHFDGRPDMWNTKPPLLIWFQVFFMKILGVNELAVRLPSALAAFFTSITLLFFYRKFLNNFWLGFIAVFILITSNGYINIHATRTGDYDALLTLFTTLSGLSFFFYSEKQNIKYLYLFFLFTTLAVLTKSVSGLLFLPGIFIYALLQKQVLPLLKNKHFYIGLLSSIIIIAGYYLLREANNPGYIAAVQRNELGGRYFDVIENHKHGFWYYYNNFIDSHLKSWYLFVPCGVIIGFFIKDEKIRKITLFSFLMIISFFLIISFAKTKLEWYDVPLYPYFAIVISIFVYLIFEFFKKNDWFNQRLVINVVPYIFLFLIGIKPYQEIINKTYFPHESNWGRNFYEMSYFLRDAARGKYDLNNKYILYDGYKAHLLFYVNLLKDKGIKISFKNWKNLNPQDIVILNQKNVNEYIKSHYNFKKINQIGNILIYKIYGNKEKGN